MIRSFESSNHPTAANGEFMARLTIELYLSGMPEPGRSAIIRSHL